ncbi:Folylpolyglutamate synthase FolC [Helicobacter trogontum]|uniref:Folylpolyglutamate synthase FolC n=1 Tax=Helicobacter trogontum TaxID=50960 RepID=A0ABQ0D4U7_9HELI
MIYQYMDSKAQEYAVFDPTRARRLFLLLQPYLSLNSRNIHIIGTNGKGSTGRFIAQSIIESGHKVLHFTSPHVFDFRERFYTNRGVVELKTLLEAHDFLQQFSFIHEASYFEYATFLALVLGRDCDYLVMEAGIGGEFDSTSILHYDITIFTRIGLDHKEMLGSTLESIALTKLRAAQGDIFTHFQEKEVLKLLENIKDIGMHTQDLGLQHIPVQKVTYLCENDLYTEEIRAYSNTHQIPHFLVENLGLASLVLKKLDIPLLKGRLDLAGRFQTISPNIVVDVGHNIMAAQAAISAAKLYFNNEPFVLIYNSYKDKEIIDIISIFRDCISEIIIFMLENPRIINPNEMENILDTLGFTPKYACDLKSQLNTNVQSDYKLENKIVDLNSNADQALISSVSKGGNENLVDCEYSNTSQPIRHKNDTSTQICYSFFCPYAAGLDLLPKKLIESGEILQQDKKYLVFGSFSLVEQFLLWFDKNCNAQ